jgi:hypothetical protein
MKVEDEKALRKGTREKAKELVKAWGKKGQMNGLSDDLNSC